MIHVLLCGGSGTRLWPLSCELKPKQFIPFFGDLSLFQKTFLGNQPLCKKTIVVCSTLHSEIAKKQMENCGAHPIFYILEGASRNTAAAISLAIQAIPPEEIVLVTPADHQIDYSSSYVQAIARAGQLSAEGSIVIFGIVPTSPETGYGYIEAEGEVVYRFHEKPDKSTALKYAANERFYWNSGMLCFKVSAFQEMMKKHAPHILEMSEKAYKRGALGSCSDPTIEIKKEDMENIPSLSIDYALLEKAGKLNLEKAIQDGSSDAVFRLKMVRSNFRWCDLGSFDSLFTQSEKDGSGNAVKSEAFYGINAKNNLVISHKLVSAIDIEDLAIIDTEDALLVARLESSQKIKDLAALFKKDCNE